MTDTPMIYRAVIHTLAATVRPQGNNQPTVIIGTLTQIKAEAVTMFDRRDALPISRVEIFDQAYWLISFKRNGRPTPILTLAGDNDAMAWFQNKTRIAA